jgi:hypothetical protein
MVRTLRMSDLRSSDRCSAVLGSRSPSIGSLRVPASFATTAAAGWLSRGGRRVQTSPTQSISEGGAIEAPFCGRKPAGTAGPGLGACLRDGPAGRDEPGSNSEKAGSCFFSRTARAVGKVSKVSLAWFSEGVRAVVPSRRAAVPPCRHVHKTLPCVPSEHSHHSPGRLSARRPLHLLPSTAPGSSRCAAGASAACSPAHPCYYGRQCVGCRTVSQSRSS